MQDRNLTLQLYFASIYFIIGYSLLDIGYSILVIRL